MVTAKKKKPAVRRTNKPSRARQCCGLCGKTGRLTETECCGNLICDDESKYVLFSFARNSCSRNHRRFTLCGYHHSEGHADSWQECPRCRQDICTEMYVYNGTNEYNFVKLPNPPSFEPTRCGKCGEIIALGVDGYSQKGDTYSCLSCSSSSAACDPDGDA